MRARLIGFVLLTAAMSAFAQQPPLMRQAPIDISINLQRYEMRLEALAAAVKREAFIESRVDLAVHELSGFQVNIAVERARDRIAEAQKRAVGEPPAPTQVARALLSMREAVDRAHDQGSATDLEALQKEILFRSHDIHFILFDELFAAEKENRALAEIQARLARLSGVMSSAVTDGLTTTDAYVRTLTRNR